MCDRDGGRLWGVSLCGPVAIADATTRTLATSQPAPAAPRPSAMGFANAAVDWGGTRWATVVWQLIPPDPHLRARMFLHELFHRIQPDLGFTPRDQQNVHLDTIDGRYWMQLEWRALAKALAASGPARTTAVRDALAFRAQRRAPVPDAAEGERLLEMNEGLAQYTGTVLAAATAAEAAEDAIEQLEQAELAPSFVRTFAYASGAAYGLLLDAWAPGWPRRIKGSDDLALVLAAASGLQPSEDAARAALQYDGAELRSAEDAREVERQARVAELRRVFVDRPVPGDAEWSQQFVRDRWHHADCRRWYDHSRISHDRGMGNARGVHCSDVHRSFDAHRSCARIHRGRDAARRRLDADARVRLGRAGRTPRRRFSGSSRIAFDVTIRQPSFPRSPPLHTEHTGSAPPDAFGPFRVLHQIGAGTLGPVYRGHDTQRERLVAVKLFKLDLPPEQVHQLVAGLERHRRVESRASVDRHARRGWADRRLRLSGQRLRRRRLAGSRRAASSARCRPRTRCRLPLGSRARWTMRWPPASRTDVSTRAMS